MQESIRQVIRAFINLPDESRLYLESAARIRRTSPERIVEMLIKQIAKDQLVLAILDDNSKPPRNQ